MPMQNSWPHRERRQFPRPGPKPLIWKGRGVPMWFCNLGPAVTQRAGLPMIVGHGKTMAEAFQSWKSKMAERI